MITRKKTRQIKVGNVAVGGDAPIAVQSMTNTDTRDVAATVAQIHRLTEAGCEIIRVAVLDLEAAAAITDDLRIYTPDRFVHNYCRSSMGGNYDGGKFFPERGDWFCYRNRNPNQPLSHPDLMNACRYTLLNDKSVRVKGVCYMYNNQTPPQDRYRYPKCVVQGQQIR